MTSAEDLLPQMRSRFADDIDHLRARLLPLRANPFAQTLEDTETHDLTARIESALRDLGAQVHTRVVKESLLRDLAADLPPRSPLPRSLDAWPIEDVASPVALVLKGLRHETHPLARLYRLLDAFEVSIKYAVAIAFGAARGLVATDENPVARGILGQIFIDSIDRPSLGHWVGYLRRLFDIGKAPMVLGLAPLSPFFRALKRSIETMVAGDADTLLTLRNRDSHGALMPNCAAESEYERHEPVFLRVLAALMPALSLPLFDSDPTGRAVAWKGTRGGRPIDGDRPRDQGPFVQIDGRIHTLFPLLHSSRQEAFHAVYNGQRAKDLDYLNYDRSVHLTLPISQAPVFLDLFRRADASQQLDRGAAQREAALQNFQGRRREFQSIATPLLDASRDRSLAMVYGAPGIGKGSLLALVADVFIRGEGDLFSADASQAIATWRDRVIHYPLSQADRDPTQFLLNVLQHLQFRLKLSVQSGGSIDDLRKNYRSGLQQIGQGDRPILFVLDGLDEMFRDVQYAADGGGLGVLDLIPHGSANPLPRNCHFLLSSRPLARIVNWWENASAETKSTALTLDGLSRDDVRRTLMTALDKYAIVNSEGFVRRVHACASDLDMRGLAPVADAASPDDEPAGAANPLYVTLVIRDVLAGRGRVRGDADLPSNLSDQYSRLLEGLLVSVGDGRSPQVGRLALQILYTLAAAYASLTPRMLAAALHVTREDVDLAVRHLQHLLVEDARTVDIEDYRIFHKSFADYLRESRRAEVAEAALVLLGFCRAWRVPYELWMRAPDSEARAVADYAVRHLTPHLVDAADTAGSTEQRAELRQEILTALDDETFRLAQFSVCGSVAPLQSAVSEGLRIIREQDRDGHDLDRFLRLIAMYHTEKHRLFERTLAELRNAADARSPLRIARLADRGDDYFHRTALVLRGLWQMADRGSKLDRNGLASWNQMERFIAQWRAPEPHPDAEAFMEMLRHRMGAPREG